MTEKKKTCVLFVLTAFFAGAIPGLYLEAGSSLPFSFSCKPTEAMIVLLTISCLLCSSLNAHIALLFFTLMFGFFAALETDAIRAELFSGTAVVGRVLALFALTSIQFWVCGLGMNLNLQLKEMLSNRNISFRINAFMLYAIMFIGFAAVLRLGPDILNI